MYDFNESVQVHYRKDILTFHLNCILICFPYFTYFPLSIQLDLTVFLGLPPAALGQDTSIDTDVDGEEDKEDEEEDSGDADDDDLKCAQECPAKYMIELSNN